MTATDPETEPGLEPIRGTFRSLQKPRPPSPRNCLAPRYRRRLLQDHPALASAEAAILDEFAPKLAAIEYCFPTTQREAARQTLLGERAAKLRRFYETMHYYEAAEREITFPTRSVTTSPMRRHRFRSAKRKDGFLLRRSRPADRTAFTPD